MDQGTLWTVLLFTVAGLAVWLAFDALRAREAAIAAAKAVCARQGVQCLDDTVRGLRTRPVRDEEGHVILRRICVFEISDDGTNRRGGKVTVQGAHVESVLLEPHSPS